MLLTEKVEINIGSRNLNYYKQQGYLNLKKGSKILVKIEDLMDGSEIKINIKCDTCGSLLNTRWVDYKKCVKEDGKYYCRECAIKLFNGKNIISTRLKNSKSFKQWCLENNRQDILDRWDYKLNNCSTDNILYKTHKKYYLMCSKGLHRSELKNIGDFTNGHNGVVNCKQCNSFAQWGIDNISKDFLVKYWDYNLNKSNPWELAKKSKKKIWIKCQEKNYHESYLINPDSFLRGNRCPHCSNKNGKVHKLDSLGVLFPQVLDIWSDKNKKSPYDYAPLSSYKVWWKCSEDKHKNYLRTIRDSTNSEFRCPECTKERNESFLQEKVRLYLNEIPYKILHEKDCTLKCINPKTRYQLPYDNEIVEIKLIIETHGSQHYLETSGKWFGFNLNKRKLYDRYKRIFAKSQGYNYLEIPYWTDDKNETWKQLINNKVEEILTNQQL